MNIYYKIWSNNKIAFISDKGTGDCYEEHFVKDANKKTHKQIREALLNNYSISDEDRLHKI